MIASMTSSLNIEQPLASGIPDTLSRLRPASEADYRKIQLEILRQRAAWVGHLRVARREMKTGRCRRYWGRERHNPTLCIVELPGQARNGAKLQTRSFTKVVLSQALSFVCPSGRCGRSGRPPHRRDWCRS